MIAKQTAARLPKMYPLMLLTTFVFLRWSLFAEGSIIGNPSVVCNGLNPDTFCGKVGKDFFFEYSDGCNEITCDGYGSTITFAGCPDERPSDKSFCYRIRRYAAFAKAHPVRKPVRCKGLTADEFCDKVEFEYKDGCNYITCYEDGGHATWHHSQCDMEQLKDKVVCDNVRRIAGLAKKQKKNLNEKEYEMYDDFDDFF